MQASVAASVAAYLGRGLRAQESEASTFEAANEQPVIGFIGTGIRYHTYHGQQALKFGPCAGIADVDFVQAGRALQAAIDIHRENGRPLDIGVHEDYRHLLDRQDVDVIVIGSVDHWHTKMVIDALNAGKDVYCEKPLTLTIREGQQIVEALNKTGRVMQVGTQQRTEFGTRFAPSRGHDARPAHRRCSKSNGMHRRLAGKRRTAHHGRAQVAELGEVVGTMPRSGLIDQPRPLSMTKVGEPASLSAAPIATIAGSTNTPEES